MPREKKNLILAAITGGVLILAFLVNDPLLIFESSYEKSKPLVKSRAERVKKIIAQDAGVKKMFTRTTDGWSLEVQGSPALAGLQRADASKIDTGLKNFFEARRYQEVSSNKEKQGEYEVHAEGFQLILEGENGEKIAHAILGKFSGAANSSFIRLADESSIYSVKGFLKGDWNQEIDQYRDRTILRIAKENIKALQVSGKQAFALKADDKGALMLDPARATDKARANTYANDVSEITGVKFYKEATLPAFYGKISITLSAGVTKDIEFFGPTKDQEFVARSTDAPQPLTLAKSKVDTLFPRLEDLVDKGGPPAMMPKN